MKASQILPDQSGDILFFDTDKTVVMLDDVMYPPKTYPAVFDEISGEYVRIDVLPDISGFVRVWHDEHGRVNAEEVDTPTDLHLRKIFPEFLL